MDECAASNPKVSILLAVYNTDPEHLAEAIDSLLAQTFTDFELVILNDASPNADVEAVVLKYADRRIRYYTNETNLGISPTRNKLIELARGEYLAVMDHDDISLPDRLAKEVAYLDANPEVGVVSCFFESFGQRTALYEAPVDDADIRLNLFEGCPLHHPAAMIRKSVLVEHGLFYEEEYSPAEDYALWCRLISHTKFHNIPEVLFKYRIHPANVSKTQAEKMRRNTIALESLIKTAHPSLYRQYMEVSVHTRRVKIFGIIPLLKMVTVGDKTTCYFFNRLPLLTLQKRVYLIK